MERLKLVNGVVADPPRRRVTRTDIAIEDGLIAEVGDSDRPANVVDLGGRLVMPGNVCAHTHLYSSLARGMPGPSQPPRNFVEILERIWWRLDRALDEESIRYSALSGALDALAAGTTTLIDHHASPNCIDGSLDMVAAALEDVGTRAVVCYEVTDRGGQERRAAGLRETGRFLTENLRPLVRGMVGAHASFTLEDDTLEALADLARSQSSGVHIHVAEDWYDEEDSLRRFGRRAAVRLDQFGILGPRAIAAHAVHVNDEEMETLHERRTWMAHNCRSNLNNGVGRAPVFNFGDRGVMGTDGIDGDMFAESRTAYFRAREDTLDADAGDFLDMLARGGRLAADFFGYPIGMIQPGAAADLVVLDYEPPTPLDGGNLPWHWMFAFASADVRDVMVGGRWVRRNREFVAIDEEKIRREAREAAVKLWQRMEML
ncbi:MAG TPA: amidohydrolase family protein [Chloroflexota bacterium]|nr:amidohydrolase family protein [Chloroflexota bacterium]